MFTGDREDRAPEQHTRLVPGVVHSQHVHRRRDADQTLEGSCPRRGSKLQKAGGRGAQGARARLRYMYKARRRYFVGDILPSRFTLGPWQRLSGIRSGIRYLDIKGRDSIFTQDTHDPASPGRRAREALHLVQRTGVWTFPAPSPSPPREVRMELAPGIKSILIFPASM